ncbi:hypothetical protein OHB56_40820 [Streptomyces sp. NBC_01635]|uniref:hypothetical protein n=1 Tax=Streptomyces sp. NBC_01635 TaxID=2975904 RepID=UPI003862F348|nr:hypothetical protein OHB56_00090 [Streptomyces sp. NBC_01635]WTD79573.1 hypothetical protein OHB56_40820 [Streptomyces sp. NBC_01635]
MRSLRERAAQAFIEVQRADTKATALCGVAGGLLALSVAVLGQTGGVSRAVGCVLVSVCLVLAASVGVALLALRPVMPAAGLQAELADGCEGCAPGGAQAGTEAQRPWEERRLRVLSRLADRKLRLIRLAGDLVIVALLLAGMGLLSGYAFN